MKVFSMIAALGLVVMASGGRAEEHQMTTLMGTGIELKEYDHAIAGEVNGALVWGVMNHSDHTSVLTMKKHGAPVTAEFKEQANGDFGGTIERQHGDMIHVMQMKFIGISKADQSLTISMNGTPVTVKVTADGFQNNHFENPTYTATYDGKTVTYTLKGKACYMYSTHLAFMILGSYFN